MIAGMGLRTWLWQLAIGTARFVMVSWMHNTAIDINDYGWEIQLQRDEDRFRDCQVGVKWFMVHQAVLFLQSDSVFFEQPILSYAEYDHNIESGRHGADREVLEGG